MKYPLAIHHDRNGAFSACLPLADRGALLIIVVLRPAMPRSNPLFKAQLKIERHLDRALHQPLIGDATQHVSAEQRSIVVLFQHLAPCPCYR